MKNALISLALLTSLAAPVAACMPIPGGNEPVSIAAEEAVIAYDAATKTERFIRKADFDPAAKEFAFLVPTPGKPTLSLSDNELFRR
ncbi:MAG: hypothetical protein H7Y38_18165, partial [Armatimonadetes bacterium]|nr:hypothetical protein [Armatimonadota bacterium]